jgi:hypothetical protein
MRERLRTRSRRRAEEFPARVAALLGSIASEPFPVRERRHGFKIWADARRQDAAAQIQIETAGCGWVQCWGGPIEVIRAGDVVCCPPGEKHWHGATPTTAMTHFAVVEKLNGKAVEWMEKVSDAQYDAGPLD